MDFHGFPWISMDFHGFPWISMDFDNPIKNFFIIWISTSPIPPEPSPRHHHLPGPRGAAPQLREESLVQEGVLPDVWQGLGNSSFMWVKQCHFQHWWPGNDLYIFCKIFYYTTYKWWLRDRLWNCFSHSKHQETYGNRRGSRFSQPFWDFLVKIRGKQWCLPVELCFFHHLM